MNGDSAARFSVHGRVQGVFFRASTREQALSLGLRGHARNVADGSVEVLALGAPESVEALAQWLAHGPPLARVERVAREACDASEIGRDFTIL